MELLRRAFTSVAFATLIFFGTSGSASAIAPTPRPFVPHWIPGYLERQPIRPPIQSLYWGPSKGPKHFVRPSEELIYVSSNGTSTVNLMLLAVPAKVFPSRFFASLARSRSWRQQKIDKRVVLLTTAREGRNTSVQGLLKVRDYLVQVTGFNIKRQDVLHFIRSLRFR